jgi:hypothetical protein
MFVPADPTNSLRTSICLNISGWVPTVTVRPFLARLVLLMAVSIPGGSIARAQTCPPYGFDEGESITGWATVDGTGEAVTEQAMVTKGTRLRLDAIATAFGSCHTQILQCNPSPCHCVDNTVGNRTINHIDIWVDVTSTGLNGHYSVGLQQGGLVERQPGHHCHLHARLVRPFVERHLRGWLEVHVYHDLSGEQHLRGHGEGCAQQCR